VPLELRHELVQAVAGGDGEGAHVIRDADRSDVIGDREVRPAARLGHLLAQGGDPGELRGAGVVGPEHDVVVLGGVGGPEPDRRRRAQQALVTIRPRSARVRVVVRGGGATRGRRRIVGRRVQLQAA